MNSQYRLSEETQEYLKTFNCILDKMIEEMTTAELNDSISHNFIVQMIPHHMAAIEMSQNILKYTNNASLINIAERIISAQTKSIENMKDVECCCNKVRNSDCNLCKYQCRIDEIMRIMFSEMRSALSTNRINCNFIREMIPHHRGAVRMSETTLRYDICPELKPILNAIITSQKRGIMQMQNLLRCLNCQR